MSDIDLIQQLEIELDLVEEVLEEALTDVRASDGCRPPDSATASQMREWRSSMSRRLLNVADRMALAEALIRNEYWRMKGLPSHDL